MHEGAEALLAEVAARVRRGTLAGADAIGVEAGKVIGTYEAGKQFTLTITDTSLSYHRDAAKINNEAELDGIYVLRTPGQPKPATGETHHHDPVASAAG